MRTGTLTARRLRTSAEIPEAATRYLYWWLLLALAFEYARPVAFVPSLNLIKAQSLVPLSLFVMTLFAKGLRPINDIFKDPIAKWVLIYFAVIASTSMTAGITIKAIETTKLVFGHVLLFFMIVRLATTPARVRGVYVVLIGAHLFLLLMNPQLVLNPEQRSYIRGGSFLGDGNDFALSVCILIPMAIELALTWKSRLLRLIGLGVLSILVLAIIGSSSRGGSLALAAVAGYLWLRSPRKMLTLFGVGAIAMLLIAYAPETYFERMGSISNYQDDGSAMGRIMAWKASIRMCLDRPLFGVGAGNFPLYFWQYAPDRVLGGNSMLAAHSMYFLVLGELGLPGIIALLTLVFGNLRANTRLQRVLRRGSVAALRRPPRSLPEAERILYLQNASLVGFAVAGAFLSVAYYPHIFVMSALMIAARRWASITPGASDVAAPARGRVLEIRPRRSGGTNRVGSRAPHQSAEILGRALHREDRP